MEIGIREQFFNEKTKNTEEVKEMIETELAKTLSGRKQAAMKETAIPLAAIEDWKEYRFEGIDKKFKECGFEHKDLMVLFRDYGKHLQYYSLDNFSPENIKG